MAEVTRNKRAYYDYFIEDKYEAGLSLEGWEVKTARTGNVSLAESFVFIRDGSAFLKNAHFAPYEYGVVKNQDSRRDRRLLLRKAELGKILKASAVKGYTLVATKMYFNSRGLLKIEIATAKGKKNFDKKQTIKERDIEREMARDVVR